MVLRGRGLRPAENERTRVGAALLEVDIKIRGRATAKRKGGGISKISTSSNCHNLHLDSILKHLNACM